MVSSYYRPRWAKLFGAASSYLDGGGSQPWSDAMAEYCADVSTSVELPWQKDTTTFPDTPTGDTVALSRKLAALYA